MPNYYRFVFTRGDAPDFDPLAIGTGLGVTQGLIAGVVIGLILVALLVWHYNRVAERAKPSPNPDR